jgi:hypothetical protein
LDGVAIGGPSVALAIWACAIFERLSARCVVALRGVRRDLCAEFAALGAQAATIFGGSVGRK